VRRRRLTGALALLVLIAVSAGALALVDHAPSGAAAPARLDPPEPPPRVAGPAAEHPAQPATPDEAEAPTPAEERLAERRRLEREIDWKRSTPAGTPNAGHLIDGVKLPHEGVHFFTWDPVRWTSPNPPARRFGTDRLVRTILEVAREHRRANPGAPRVAVGDLSRPQGGSFDATHGIVGEFGPGRGTLGHVSHQNGLDVDIYYPRRDRRERGPTRLEQVDLELAQDLVDRFVAAGAQHVFIGPDTPLAGPPGVVQVQPRHNDHIHVRLPPAG
jgi:hypothetical protein